MTRTVSPPFVFLSQPTQDVCKPACREYLEPAIEGTHGLAGTASQNRGPDSLYPPITWPTKVKNLGKVVDETSHGLRSQATQKQTH